jgi:phosphoribosylformylglycinamidine synthase
VTVRAILARAPGTNCERELAHAFERAGAKVEVVRLAELVNTNDPFGKASIVGFPGGFSYGDDVASGKIFAVEMGSRLAERLRAFLARGGFALGVCNGFQVLAKSGILPGLTPGAKDVTLANNRSGHFEDRWVRLESLPCPAKFVTPGEILELPIAHAEGRFVARDAATLQGIVDRGLVAFRYVGKGGAHPAEYPDNPNGSALGIAGICDPTGHVLGLMPHPERNVDPWHHPAWTRGDGREEGAGLRLIRALVDEARRES